MTATTMTMTATTTTSTSIPTTFTILTTTEILRHGKQAGNDSKKSAPPAEPAQPAKTASKQSSPTKDQKRTSRDGAAQQEKSGKSKNYREEAEKIVAQEKAQGEKMPKFEVSCEKRNAS